VELDGVTIVPPDPLLVRQDVNTSLRSTSTAVPDAKVAAPTSMVETTRVHMVKEGEVRK
jgi:hypothetical protein